MKKQLLITLVFLIATLVFLTGAVGATGRNQRPVIAFFYVDGLEAGQVEKETIKQQTLARFAKSYAATYELRSGDGYSGISRFTDLQNLDRFDLLPQLKDDKIDYAVFYDLLPFRTKKGGLFQLATTVSEVHVRVFDLRKNTYVSDVSLSYSSRWAWLNGRCEKLFADADSKVFSQLFSKGV